MGLLNLEIWKFSLILLFAITIVSGDVNLQNSYFAGGSESHESIYLHDMTYSNSASIYSTGYYANAQAGTENESDDAKFEHTAYMNSDSGMQGASLKSDAEDQKYTRSISGGDSNSIFFTYFTNSGILQADYFTPTASYVEDLSMVNSTYSADFGVFNSKAYSQGGGESAVDAPSSFKHNISMRYLDKYCDIKSALNTSNIKSGDHLVSYEWRGYSSQINYAVAGINMNVIPGNRTVHFQINGTSSILEDKTSPDWKNNDTFPAILNDDGEKFNRILLMQYKLNRTG